MSLQAFYTQYYQNLRKVSEEFWTNEKHLETLEKSALLLCSRLKNGNKILACGNGGSMSDAIHFAEELVGRFRENRRPLPAIALSDVGMLSCIANDFGYEEVFARALEALGQKGDVLLAISTSGNSKNILRAAEQARKQGISVLALTGKDGGKLKELADISVIVPHFGYADRIQEIHIQIIHSFIEIIEKEVL